MNKNNSGQPRQPNEPWSGEATRNQGFAVEEARVDVTIGDSEITETVKQKDRPVWMTESTVISTDTNNLESSESILQRAAQSSTHQATASSSTNSRNKKENEDIMSVLLQHEKNNKGNQHNTAANALEKNLTGGNSSESSGDDEHDIENAEIRKNFFLLF